MASSSYMAGRRKYLKGATRPQAILFSDNAGTLSEGKYVPIGDEGSDFIILTDGNRGEISMSQQRIESRQRMINGNMRSYWTADKLNMSTSWSRIPSRAYSTYVTFDPNNGEIDNNPDTYSMYTVDGGAGGVDILEWYESHPGPFYVFLSYDKFGMEGSKSYSGKVARILATPKPTCTSNEVTVYTENPFDFQVGEKVVISGLTDENNPTNTATPLNGSYYITQVAEDKKSFKYSITASPSLTTLSSTGGVASQSFLDGYNQVLKMYVSSFDYSIEKRGGTAMGNMWSNGKSTGYDFWNISMSLEEV